MKNRGYSSGGARRLFQAVVLSSALIFGVSACGGDDTPSSSEVQSDPKQASAAVEAGLTAHASGDLEAASALYQEALTYDESNHFAIYNLALIDEANGNYGLAEEKYRQVIEIEPSYEPALFNLAILRSARGDNEEALTLYQSAVESKPEDAAAWLNLGLLLREEGQKKAGDRAVLRAIALNPDLKDPDGTLDDVGPAGTTP